MGRPTTASAALEKYPPYLATDGVADDLQSSWQTDPYPAWLEIDLQTSQTINRVQVAQVVGTLLIAYFLFGLIYAWYAAGRLNYFAAHTRLSGATFKLRARVPSLIWLTATNFFLRFCTLGILSPVAEARSMRYIIDRLSIEGEVPWSEIKQNPDALLKRGEGLAEALNVDAF